MRKFSLLRYTRKLYKLIYEYYQKMSIGELQKMSTNRKRNITRSLQSYFSETGLSNYLDIKKPEPKLLVQKKQYTFGLPSELIRSPVHGFYRWYTPDITD